MGDHPRRALRPRCLAIHSGLGGKVGEEAELKLVLHAVSENLGVKRLRIVSWNIRGLKATVGAQAIADAVLKYVPDVIVLQEYRASENGAFLTRILQQRGLVSYDRPTKSSPLCIRTVAFTSVLTSLLPVPAALTAEDPFWIELGLEKFNISATHIPLPGKYSDWRKAHWQSALSLVASVGNNLHLLIGDLNTTRHGIDECGSSVPGDHYLRELEAGGWREAWRTMHPNPEEPEFSWYHHVGTGFRIDQAWLSPGLAPYLVSAQMDHDVRKSRLSDHSMLIVDLSITPSPPATG
jgi:exodeoxyribonuclease III